MKNPRLSFPSFIWLSLWSFIGIGTIIAMKQADRAFVRYLNIGSPSIHTAGKLLPSNIQTFVYSTNFSQNWKLFKQTGVYSALKSTPILRHYLETWKLNDKESSSFERLILQALEHSAIAAYSSEDQILYLLSPLGTREQCLEWLKETVFSSYENPIKWVPQRLQSYWCFEAEDSSILPSEVHMQLTAIHGVAVIAIGRRNHPLLKVIQTTDTPLTSLYQFPSFVHFLTQSLQQPSQIYGFVRLSKNGRLLENLGVEWNLSFDSQQQVAVNICFPKQTMTPSPLSKENQKENERTLEKLAVLRQPDHLVSVVSSLESLKTIWQECIFCLPSDWTNSLQQIDFNTLLGSCQNLWKPVLEKLGCEFFAGFGKGGEISEKYQIPFPGAVVAFPFNEIPTFVKALEATVLKCNRELQANLMIRKAVQPYGEYYEVRIGNSTWQTRYGLKELPVFGFAHGLLIIGSNANSIEKALQHLAENLSRQNSTKIIEGLNLRINMRQAPESIRILLATIGALNSQGENIFLSPSTMRSLSECFSVMEQFGDSQITIIPQSESIHLRALLGP